MNKKFVGFGFGPIQSGLMLYEAMQSGNFDTFTIVEVDQSLVDTVRKNGDAITINIAHQNRIEQATLSGFNLYNPRNPEDLTSIRKAIHEADEMATAIPSVDFYSAGGDISIARLLADNINTEKEQILYASENNNYAAEILHKAILKYTSESKITHLHILDTVIGKMSGVKTSAHDIEELGLAPIIPGVTKAVLVEEFNKIYVSKPRVHIDRGITVFEEKSDLIPFEEAKLFGHNAIHSLLGYLAASKGYRVMSDIRKDKALLDLGRKAFMDECGVALVNKYKSFGDPLFTITNFTKYADDLIERMTNPYLHDEVARICRDPKRKLAFGDRLVGTMREALKQDIQPVLIARGAAAAVKYLYANEDTKELPQLDLSNVSRSGLKELFLILWSENSNDPLFEKCIDLIFNEWNHISPV